MLLTILRVPCVLVSILVGQRAFDYPGDKCPSCVTAQKNLNCAVVSLRKVVSDETNAERAVNAAILRTSMYSEDDVWQVSGKFKSLQIARQNVLLQRLRLNKAIEASLQARSFPIILNPVDASRNQLMSLLASNGALQASYRLGFLKAKLAKCRASMLLSRGKDSKKFCTAVLEELKKLKTTISLKYEYVKYFALGEHRKPLKIVSNFQIIN